MQPICWRLLDSDDDFDDNDDDVDGDYHNNDDNDDERWCLLFSIEQS